MRKPLWQFFKPVLFSGILIIPLIGIGCSSGSSNSSSTSTTSTTTSSGTSLKVAEKVSVVDSQSGSSGSSVRALKMGNLRLGAAVADLPATSAYNTDTQFIFVEERSASAFDLINEILCMMAQSKYDLMVNQGDYKAQIDITQCSQSKDSASSAGQSSQNTSSGSNAAEYEYWTVNSSRVDNDSPHIVKVWMHQKAEDFQPASVINVNINITEAATTSNPYGLFVMNFSAHPKSNTSLTTFKGFLKAEKDSSTSDVLLKFYNSGGFDQDSDGINDFEFTEKVTINRSSDGSSGSGTISKTDSSDTISFNIAYDDNYFFREDKNATQTCLTRTNPDVTALRYGLYYDENAASPGGRVELNSGFPVRYNDGSKDYFGWVGFWGMWFPEDVSVSDGATVYKQDFSSSGTNEEAYSLVVKNGKLKKHTKSLLTLSEIKNLPLDYWTDSGNFRVKWDGTDFVKFASLDETQFVWKDITETVLDVTALQFTDLNFWSQSLGGNVRILLESDSNPCTDNGNNTFDCTGYTPTGEIVVFYEETTINPGDTVPSTLLCISQCPDPSTFGDLSGGNAYFSTSDYQPVTPANANYKTYTFDTSTMMLTSNDAGNADVALTTEGSGTLQWGVNSGPLFENTSANLTALECDFNSNNTCGWSVWSDLATFYTWETGPNSWNKLSLLQNASDSTYLTFDPPIAITYTHTQTDTSASDFKYNGTKFYLEYNGFGELHGIPGKCVDMDEGEDTDCFEQEGDDRYIRWVNEFSISDGSSVSSSSTSYYVKALEKEERMKSTTTSECTNAGLSLSTYALPDETLWEDPDIGTEPTVTDAPAVIGGVVQS